MLAVKLLQIKTIKDQVIGFEQVGISKGILEREENSTNAARCGCACSFPLASGGYLLVIEGWEEGGVVNSPTPSVQWLAWARAVACSCKLSVVWLPTPLGHCTIL